MDITCDEMTLATIKFDIAAGLKNISSQLDRLAAALLKGSDGRRERIDLLALENNQASLHTRQSATLNRIAKASAAPVVLVVDDEPIVLMSAADHLTSAGFSVVEVTNADQAIEALERDDSISAVFTDVQMRGSMNGLELMRIVHLRWPEIRVVVTSGNQMFSQRDVAPGDHFIRKPYAAEDVANALRTH
jgi:two-component system, response regulator PdtaR